MERQLSARAAMKASELAKAHVQQAVRPDPVKEERVERVERVERRLAKLTKAQAKKALKEAIVTWHKA